MPASECGRTKIQTPNAWFSSSKMKARSFHEQDSPEKSRLLGNIPRLSEGRGPIALSMAFKRNYSNPASYSHILREE